MPATSRSGERLARRSSKLRAGSPSKSMIRKSLFVQQHLAQMVVAVQARLERLARRVGAGGEAAEQAVSRRRARPRASSRTVAGRSAMRASQEAHRRIQVGARLLAVGDHVGAGQGLGLERGIAARARERQVQLGGARAQHLHQRQVGAVHVRRRLARAWCAGPRGSARDSPPCRPSHRPGSTRTPGASRASACVPSSAVVLHGAGHRHAVRELRHLGEEAADLQLRAGCRRAAAGSP